MDLHAKGSVNIKIDITIEICALKFHIYDYLFHRIDQVFFMKKKKTTFTAHIITALQIPASILEVSGFKRHSTKL